MGDGSVVLVVGVALVVGLLALGIWYQAVRRRRLTEWAARNGWVYADSDDSLVTISDRYPFGEGHHRRTAEVLRGQFSGRDATSFVYRWRTGNGNTPTQGAKKAEPAIIGRAGFSRKCGARCVRRRRFISPASRGSCRRPPCP